TVKRTARSSRLIASSRRLVTATTTNLPAGRPRGVEAENLAVAGARDPGARRGERDRERLDPCRERRADRAGRAVDDGDGAAVEVGTHSRPFPHAEPNGFAPTRTVSVGLAERGSTRTTTPASLETQSASGEGAIQSAFGTATRAVTRSVR